MATDPEELIAHIDSTADRCFTPAGHGYMVWRIWGKGPPLVLLHGGHGSWTHWIRNIPRLQTQFRLYVPDIPGMGGSASVGGDRIEPVADAIARGLDALNIDDGYFLAGFSYGAAVAGYVLRRHAGRIRRLFIIGAGGLGRIHPVVDGLKRWQEIADPVARRAVHEHNLSLLMLRDRASIDELAITIQATNSEAARVSHRKAAMAADLAACLAACPVPVTAIWGAEDALTKGYLEERRDFLRGLRPAGEFITLHGAGHWVQYETADAMNDLLIERISSGAPN